MTLVILTALGVGLATLLGGVLGFIFRNVAKKYGEEYAKRIFSDNQFKIFKLCAKCSD